MAFGSKVDHAVDAVFLKDSAHRLEVTDIGTHEHVVRGLLDVLQVGQVARVGQLVQVYDTVLGVLVHEKAHDVAPDEARAAGYQYVALVFHCQKLLFVMMFPGQLLLLLVGDTEQILTVLVLAHGLGSLT